MKITKETMAVIILVGGIVSLTCYSMTGFSIKSMMEASTVKGLLNPQNIILLVSSAAAAGLALASIKKSEEKSLLYVSIPGIVLFVYSLIIIPDKTEALFLGGFLLLGLVLTKFRPGTKALVYSLAIGLFIAGVTIVSADQPAYEEEFKQEMKSFAQGFAQNVTSFLSKDDVRSMIEEQKLSREDIQSMVLSVQGITSKEDLRAKIEKEYQDTYGSLWNMMTEAQRTELVDNATNTAWENIQRIIDEQYQAQSDPQRIDQMVDKTYQAIVSRLNESTGKIGEVFDKIVYNTPFFKSLLKFLPFLYGILAFTAVTIYGAIITPFYWIFSKILPGGKKEKPEYKAKMPKELTPEEREKKTVEEKAKIEEEAQEVLQKGRAYKEKPAAEHKRLKLGK